jgi:hypothetical protein
MDDFDQIDQLTRRLGRWAAVAAVVGLPIWLLLLAVLPRVGLGVGASFLSASAVAVAAVVLVLRRGAARRGRPASRRPRGARSPMTPLAAAGLTLAAVAVLVYVILVLRAA